MEVIGSTEPDWECDYSTWQTGFSTAVPTVAFTVSPAKTGESHELPGGKRAERSDEVWVVRDEQEAYWCGLIENGWTDVSNEIMPALSFTNEADAKSAFAQADRLYDERAKRRTAACERLDISEE